MFNLFVSCVYFINECKVFAENNWERMITLSSLSVPYGFSLEQERSSLGLGFQQGIFNTLIYIRPRYV